jgi:hypothetical protein
MDDDYDEEELMRGGDAMLASIMAREDVPELPKDVLLFRQVINDIKREIFTRLDKESDSGKDGIHSIRRLNEAVDRIKQLGNILIMILKSNDCSVESEYVKEAGPVMDTFNTRGFDFSKMSSESRSLCLHYVWMDIDVYTYDLSCCPEPKKGRKK